RSPFTEQMPAPPLTAQIGGRQDSEQRPRISAATDQPASLNVRQVPVGDFARLVYANILQRSVVIEDAVLASRDLVTVRTPEDLSPEEIEKLASSVLGDYGITTREVDGIVRVSKDAGNQSALPEIRRGAALPEMPSDLRPIFQMIDLSAVRNSDVASWIRTMFGDRIQMREDPTRNAIVLQGQPDAVNAAAQAIRVLDQPVMQGRRSVRINPEHWSADDLVGKLSDVLAAEGYSVPPANFSPRAGGSRYPVILLPVSQINAILVFTTGDDVLAHVLNWAKELDVPVEPTVSEASLISYTPRNTTAEHLAGVLQSILTGQSSTSSSSGARNTTSSQSTSSSSSNTDPSQRSMVVVDSATNTLIFRADAEDRKTIMSILRSLDQPTRSALIEVTIAEVQLDDENEFGVQWLLRNAAVGDVTRSISIGSGGFDINWLNSAGDARGVVNALASSNRATILSTPSIMARNGESAEIQVGQEVPIITSQQSGLSSGNLEMGGVLQSIQYRSTGVILKVTPTIHSGDLVDIEVEQEVSSAQATVTGVQNSPTISTRRMSTKLNLRHGSTVLLGGLISSEVTMGQSGVPLLKDIPGLGRLFSNTTERERRTELVILITPYILSESNEYEAILRSFNERLSLWHEHVEP
ncbi:MAG: hypothetical protein M1363_02560, partial [Gammaproteobacteria bacterium]|nr:hypothetical protein [Gammaproteobacteria bacterium]